MHDAFTQRPWLDHYDRNVPSTLSYEDKTFAETFLDVVRLYPEKTALIYLGVRLSFRELDALSNQLAHFFAQSGLKPDDVVGLHLPNIPAHYIAVIAAQKAGCVTTGLSPLLTPAEMAHQLRDSQAKMVITADLLLAKLAQVADECPFTTIMVSEIADFLPPLKRFLGKLLKKIPTAEVKPVPGKKIHRLTERLPAFPREFAPVRRTMDDTIFMMYTGGTTGLAKGAVLTQRNYMRNRRQVLTWLDSVPEDTALSAFPMFHIAGLALGGFMMTLGATQICVPNPRDSHFLIEAIRTYRPTCIVNVPTVYFEMMKKPEFKALDWSGVKWCLSAAAPFPAENIKELESIIGEGNFIELYGMTETSPVTCCNPRYGKKKAGSIGMPMPDTEFKLIDPTTREPVKTGEPGEIAIRGPQVMKGYFGQPEETKNVLRDGWLYTGDIARMDEEGYFSIVDRLKDMAIISGFKVFTRELDEVLCRHPDVQMAASVGLPDPERPGSERVGCAIILRPGIEAGAAEKEKILGYLKENVAPYKVPKVITFMDQLPTSGVGKILKRELKQMLAEQSPKG
ncbi:MAG: AMP-binding protein [Deltaproteobacteria bacterium]|nr:AMP-binding protein [Deltaproteobacteria bacterium]